MRLSTHTVRLIFAALLLASPTTALGKPPLPRRAHEILPTLKTGQWIRLESVQKDTQVLCTELRLLAGDFLDDDWSLRGRVETIDARARRFSIGPISVLAAEHAMIENSHGVLEGLSDIRKGMIVEVDGTYLRNGTFRAKEIEDESHEGRGIRGMDDHLVIVGKVEQIDPGRRRITVMGTDFLITEKTQLKSVIR